MTEQDPADVIARPVAWVRCGPDGRFIDVDQNEMVARQRADIATRVTGKLHTVAALVLASALEAVIRERDALAQRVKELEGDKKFLGPYATAAEAFEELRAVVADIIGADIASWPSHGNASLAIASSIALEKNRATTAEAEVARKDVLLAKARAVMHELAGDGWLEVRQARALLAKIDTTGGKE